MTANSSARIVVLASGEGSNLQAVIDACHAGRLPAQVTAVVSNRAGSGALRRALAARIPAVHVGVVPDGAETREEYDVRLAAVVAAHRPDFVVCAGWMRLLSMRFLERFPGQVVNLHPALPGELPGTDAIARAFAEHRTGTRTRTGVMIHLIPDEGVDDGPVLAMADVPIHPDDTLERLAARVHATEHDLLVRTLHTLCLTGLPTGRATGGQTPCQTGARP